MSKTMRVVLIVFGVFIAFYLLVGVPYNHLVSLDQQAKTQWAQVEVVLQRRFDLIPNLVATVKGYAGHEEKVFGEIAKAQNAWASAPSGSPERITAATRLESSIGSLLTLVQTYPKLQANEDFRALMDELEGTENRISVERHRYNDIVRQYDTAVASFPASIYARSFGFKPLPYFQAQTGAEQAPKVKF